MTNTSTTQTLEPTITLASLVDYQPKAARILESFGLDYCCGGKTPLNRAAARLSIDPQQVLDQIAALGTPTGGEWTTMTATELVDHIESTHHAYLHSEFPRLEFLTEKVLGVHGANHPDLVAIAATYRELRDDLEPHLMKEERVLFPMIRELFTTGPDGTPAPNLHGRSLAAPISMMMVEHDRAGELLAQLHDLTDAYQPPDDACASYRALFAGYEELETDTHLHVHKENNLLFPMVQAEETRLGV